MGCGDDWLYIVDAPKSGGDNMRADRTLLKWAEECPTNVTAVRFYRWTIPTISLGRNQKIQGAIDPCYCRQEAIPIVRRPTGGRAVFHHDEVTYALVSNDDSLFPLMNISGTYRLIASALQAGLERLGILTTLAKKPSDDSSSIRDKKSHPCFISPSRNELLSGDLKIVGSAQKQLRRSFLQHGSIPLRVDYTRMAKALASEETVLHNHLTSLLEVTGREITFEETCKALKKGIEETFSVQLQSSHPAQLPRTLQSVVACE